ncbi:hypothetical protein [Streptomyces sp. NPDC005989]|uniref:hypothetical protein n=1 Tax=Streptomyces TaxID=1883 RepID=UPI0033F3910C
MNLTRYRVVDADGTFLDEFTTNSPAVASERIGRLRKHHPDLKITETAVSD